MLCERDIEDDTSSENTSCVGSNNDTKIGEKEREEKKRERVGIEREI